MNWDDPKIIAATISAVVSIIVVVLSFILRSFFERHFHMFKLEAEHEYEQRKKIKDVIAQYKTRLLDAAETLNHRLWNFADNYGRNWHTLGDKKLGDTYYPASFTYRLLAFFAWSRKVEIEMVYLDSTIASKSDLSFVKFIKFFPQIMCDSALFEGLDYDDEFDTDHFFTNDFTKMCETLFTDTGVATFAQYQNNQEKMMDNSIPMAEFISEMTPQEERLRWDRLQAFHYVLMMFLNKYGYDFQYTNRKKVREVTSRARRNRTLDNMEMLLQRIQLSKEKEVKRVLKVLRRL